MPFLQTYSRNGNIWNGEEVTFNRQHATFQLNRNSSRSGRFPTLNLYTRVVSRSLRCYCTCIYIHIHQKKYTSNKIRITAKTNGIAKFRPDFLYHVLQGHTFFHCLLCTTRGLHYFFERANLVVISTYVVFLLADNGWYAVTMNNWIPKPRSVNLDVFEKHPTSMSNHAQTYRALWQMDLNVLLPYENAACRETANPSRPLHA